MGTESLIQRDYGIFILTNEAARGIRAVPGGIFLFCCKCHFVKK